MAVAQTMMRPTLLRRSATEGRPDQLSLPLFGLEAVPLKVPDKPTLRPDEVARLLRCSDEHVRHLIEEGTLAAVDVRCAGAGRPAMRIVQASVVKFVNERKTL